MGEFFNDMSFGFSRKHFPLIYGKSKWKSQLLMNNLTTFNNISDKQFASEAYI